jgi:imidazolonepropionase-like amidohydrolase
VSLRAIVGATVIDGTGQQPVADAVVMLDGSRIRSVGRAAEVSVPQQAEVIRAHGRYVIPGLMDANVHLYAGITPDLVLEFEGRYDELVLEAAQVALRSGITTVFDTWGPLEPLLRVRDRINRGEVVGSRMYVAGHIIGFGGPLSSDLFPPGSFLAPETVNRINQQWEQGLGPELTYLPPEDVRHRVREYLARAPVDFLKYAGSGHGSQTHSFITFSAPTQRAIVEEAHRAGLTAQAHTTTVESLRMEIEAGADILQHGDTTGPVPMPEATLKTIVERHLPVAALVCTKRYMAWVREHGNEFIRTHVHNDAQEDNDQRLIEAGATLLLTTDSSTFGPRKLNHPLLARWWKGAADFPLQLGESQALWLEGVIERGMAPMDALMAATRNVAEAYGKSADLGTVEAGKFADLLILEGDPLADVGNYRRIAAVIKSGAVVDRDALPTSPILTAPDADAGGGASEQPLRGGAGGGRGE